ncbi:hypothetical protein CAPTEDRAFT_195238 [Capitella teleta]|uniref:F-box domain-containing protein n=1 Tax=Capitella teleta TaxID=283909 RepID=R7VAP2_CAPTE|nr:hypothetical protein CAPTEDRAFT_195238 [Capitella teleta]|eukprot:ELU15602.1 hypothetical protein CAPTEDRAFT_195238 [Capitella teleta]
MLDFAVYLPREIMEKVLSYFSARELSQIALCNKLWRDLSNTDALWLHQCMIRGWLKYGVHEIVNCCDFDKKRIVSGSSDGTAKVWSSLSGRCTATLFGHSAEVYCIAYTGQYIATGSSDSSVKVWNLQVKARYNDTHYTDKFTYRQLFGRNRSATMLKA